MKNLTDSKKILLVHNYYKIPGGEDTVVENEKKILETKGHQVFFYSRKNSEIDSFSKLKKLLLPITTVFNLKTYRDVKKMIRDNQIDLVHVHNTLNLVSPSVYYAARSCKVPIVQTIHNFRLLCPAATFYRDGHICEECVQKGLHCAVRYRCYRGSKLQTMACVVTTRFHRMMGIYKKLNYICLAEFNREKLLQLNNVGKKPLICPERVYIKPNMTFETAKAQEQKEGTYYLFAGRVEAIKGMDLLLEAFSKLPQERLLVAGTGTELEHYRSLAKKMNLNNVEFLGFVQKEQLQDTMKNAKALIIPSQWYETFGMTVIEAFAQGTPVIGGDIGNISSLIREGVNGWKFRYDSADALIEKVEVCSKTPKSQLQVACDKAFFPEGNYEVLMEIYEAALKNN